VDVTRAQHVTWGSLDSDPRERVMEYVVSLNLSFFDRDNEPALVI